LVSTLGGAPGAGKANLAMAGIERIYTASGPQ
jgi:hypothetical protein